MYHLTCVASFTIINIDAILRLRYFWPVELPPKSHLFNVFEIFHIHCYCNANKWCTRYLNTKLTMSCCLIFLIWYCQRSSKCDLWLVVIRKISFKNILLYTFGYRIDVIVRGLDSMKRQSLLSFAFMPRWQFYVDMFVRWWNCNKLTNRKWSHIDIIEDKGKKQFLWMFWVWIKRRKDSPKSNMWLLLFLFRFFNYFYWWILFLRLLLFQFFFY